MTEKIMEELKYLTDLYNSQLAISMNLWNFFIVVSIGALGFVYGSTNLKKRTVAVLSIGFVLFGVANQGMILRTQNVLYESVNEISTVVEQVQVQVQVQVQDQDQRQDRKAVMSVSSAAKKLEATEANTVAKYHSAMILVVLVGVWSPYLIRVRDRKEKSNEANKLGSTKG
jgi:hypothetical protein